MHTSQSLGQKPKSHHFVYRILPFGSFPLTLHFWYEKSEQLEKWSNLTCWICYCLLLQEQAGSVTKNLATHNVANWAEKVLLLLSRLVNWLNKQKVLLNSHMLPSASLTSWSATRSNSCYVIKRFGTFFIYNFINSSQNRAAGQGSDISWE